MIYSSANASACGMFSSTQERSQRGSSFTGLYTCSLFMAWVRDVCLVPQPINLSYIYARLHPYICKPTYTQTHPSCSGTQICTHTLRACARSCTHTHPFSYLDLTALFTGMHLISSLLGCDGRKRHISAPKPSSLQSSACIH